MKQENEETLKRLEEWKGWGVISEKGFKQAKERLEKDQEKGVVLNDDIM